MAKRIFDFLLAVAALIFLAPLFLLLALSVKLDSQGPIFFRQGRVGKDGKLFQVLKVRTMVDNAYSLGPRLTKNQTTMFSILHDAGRGGLAADEWNARTREAGIGTNRKADLFDTRRALKSKGLIYESSNKWFVK